MKRKYFIGFFLAAALTGCFKDVEIEKPIQFLKPSNFPAPHYEFKTNTLTQDGFILGRKLFYDPILSRDSSTSCGSCHQQFVAFAHSGHRLSHGVDHLFGTRNSPGIFNAAWNKNFMWDGGVNHIEVMPTAPITNPVEMDETMLHVVQKLNRNSAYKQLFKNAFGTDTIDDRHMLYALSQFMGAMVSANSKYDKYVRGEKGGTFNTDEKAGLELFKKNCTSCHSGELFTDYSFANNGLDKSFSDDEGRGLITLLDEDKGKFRIPSLRNVEVTSPYMHDGRFWTLEEVITHYAEKVVSSSTIDQRLIQENGKLGIVLTKQEQTQIITFLKTLTDYEFMNDKRFSEP